MILAAILLSQVGDVFVAGQDGYHTYRIPSALTTSKGTVLAFCEGPAAYSCLTPLPGGGAGCLYETGSKSAFEKIVFARLTPE